MLLPVQKKVNRSTCTGVYAVLAQFRSGERWKVAKKLIPVKSKYRNSNSVIPTHLQESDLSFIGGGAKFIFRF